MSLARAVVIQGRVLNALVLREMLVEFGLSRLSLAWLFLEPAMAIVGIFAVMLVFRSLHPPAGMSLAVFIITGYLAFQAFSRNFLGVGNGKKSLLMFPHVTVLDLIVSRAIMNWFVYLCLFVMFSSLAVLFSRGEPPADPLGVFLIYCALAVLGLAVGMMLTVFERFTNILDLFWRLVRRTMIFFCGVMHPGTNVPSALLPYLSWNPIFHAIELLREAWWPAYRSPFADPQYVAQCAVLMIAFAMTLEKATRRWIDR